jgi:hypothetical protein
MDATTSDVAADGLAPDAGFTLSLSTTHLTEDIGDTFPVTITVNRAASFSGVVSYIITAPPTLTTTNPAPSGPPSQFYVTAASGAGDVTVTVTGTSGSLVETATLGVHIGSILYPDDAGVVVIPSFASSVTVKAWGAAGGGGPDCTGFGPSTGGLGGGGGFASAVLPVSGGETLQVVVGTGGTGITAAASGNGAGGGGYSGLLTPDGGVVLLAGGGGGGNAAFCTTGEELTNANGPNGGAGGGTSGGNGGGSTFVDGYGAQPDGGGAAHGSGVAGSYLQGGTGGGAGDIAGGQPNAGNGSSNQGGGGGGSGYFGGGGGGAGNGSAFSPAGAGGGGCGWNAVDGGVLTQASGATPPNTTDPDYGDAGVGTGSKSNGMPGRVVIRLPKP